MGLDVYVMPIWKFKAGDFESPLEALGSRVVIIGPGTIMQRKPAARPSFVAQWKAKRATQSLRREIEAEIRHSVRWNDEGGIAYRQKARGFESLRAFAKWLDCGDVFPTFEPPPENNYYKHPVVSQQLTRPLTYPQLVEHCCYSGYYIPAELERVVHVEPFTSWGGFVFKHSVGSSHRLLAEMEKLAQVLRAGELQERLKGNSLAEVTAAFEQLYEIAKVSRQHDLPIVFYG